MPEILNPQVGEVLQRYVVEFLSNYEQHECQEFPGRKTGYYYDCVREMVREGKRTLFVDFAHISEIDPDSISVSVKDLKDIICQKYYSVREFLDAAVPQFMRLMGENEEEIEAYLNSQKHITKFKLAIFNFPLQTSLRSLQMNLFGQLTEITGTVTRTTETKPELLVGVFECGVCGTQIGSVVQEFKFTEPVRCPAVECGNKKSFTLVPTHIGTQYGDWQRIRIQESEHDIPLGSMPRTLDVIVRGEMCENCKAGDKVAITGCLVVVPDVPALMKTGEFTQTIRRDVNKRFRTNYQEGVTGTRNLGHRELTYKTMFYGSVIRKLDQAFDTIGNQDDAKENFKKPLGDRQRERLHQISKHTNAEGVRDAFEILAKAVAPSVHGHLNIKKGMLLQMVGGVQKETHEGIKIRSDLNVCIIGDPSTAKSQFLKYVADFIPRSVYTSGKTSTAAGLTASVTRDEDANDMVIEPGAMMLADNGICAIDEFDKMDPKDQSAIHEAMEQQTITLSKAGIHATLMARASVLAAANPNGNVYDSSKTLAANVNLSQPIMSRFDLFFILRDKPDDRALDQSVAEHIVKIHQYYDQREKVEETEDKITQEDLKMYINQAQHITPAIGTQARRAMVRAYKRLRQASVRRPGAFPITVRQLESMIRLSEAIARIYLEAEITEEIVEYAFDLMQATQGEGIGEKITLEMDEEEREEIAQQEGEDVEMGEGEAQIPAARNPNAKKHLDFAQYKAIVDALMEKMLEVEQEEDGKNWITVSELMEWYLEKLEDELQTEEEAKLKMEETRLVINRMINKDFVLDIYELDLENADNNKLKKHPNYVQHGFGGKVGSHLEQERKKK